MGSRTRFASPQSREIALQLELALRTSSASCRLAFPCRVQDACDLPGGNGRIQKATVCLSSRLSSSESTNCARSSVLSARAFFSSSLASCVMGAVLEAEGVCADATAKTKINRPAKNISFQVEDRSGIESEACFILPPLESGQPSPLEIRSSSGKVTGKCAIDGEHTMFMDYFGQVKSNSGFGLRSRDILLKHLADNCPKPLPTSLGNEINYPCQNLGTL